MQCLLRDFRSKAPLNILCRCLRASAQLSAKSSRRTKLDTAFTPHFESKLRNWKKLIELELKERAKCDRSGGLFSRFGDLEFQARSIKRSVSGMIVELSPLSKFDANSLDETLRMTISMLNPGTPVILRQVIVNNDDVESNHIKEFRGVIIGTINEFMQIKLKNFNDKNNKDITMEGTRFSLKSSFEHAPLENLLKLLSDRKYWSEFPGFPLLLYAYRARQLPIAYSDRPISLSKDFNEEQRLAIVAAVNSRRPITAVHGPPGTGKTKVIVEIIAEMVRQKKSVLVCAPSHKAVMNVLVGCRRKGLERYCKIHSDDSNAKPLTSLMQSHPYYFKLENFYTALNTSEITLSVDSEFNRRELVAKTNALERQIQKSIAENTRILFCTISSCSVRKLLDLGFEPDLTIIDEAGQSFECETWPMLFQAPRAVIVGDHNQIPPLVLSEAARAGGMNTTLTEWLSKEFSRSINFPLCVQYRSNSSIMRWSSAEFYNNKLSPHYSCANNHLSDLFGKFDWNPTELVEETNETNIIDDPLILIDTDLFEDDLEKLDSKTRKLLREKGIRPELFAERHLNHSALNAGEALICARQIISLTRPGLIHPTLIGCITPYLAQTNEIAKHLPKELLEQIDISSVDAFQGQEREAIVMSFVRNNKSGTIGFLEDIRRLNVAITRAKRQFFLVASARMMNTNLAINRLYNVIKNEGRIISPMQILSPKLLMQTTITSTANENKQKLVA